MRSKIVFIAGIHGVGKTTLCGYLSKELSIKNYSASALIKEYAKIELPKNKKIQNIQGNQDILIKAINELLKNEETCIIDGHFCLFDQAAKITRIPSATFEEMKPMAIVCLYEDIDIINQRLKSRDSHEHDDELLYALQEEEKSYSKEVSNLLGIPCFLGKPEEDREKIFAFVSDAIKEN